MDPITFRPSTDLSRTYVYTGEYGFSDAFGNVYTAQLSAPLSVVVSVAPNKVTEALIAMGAMIVFEAFALIGAALLIIAAATAYPANLVPAIAGGICLVIAVAALGIAIWRKTLADDPPLPDLDYRERVALEPPSREAFDPVVAQRPAFAALESLFVLLERVQSSDVAMHRIHRKILGARLDGATEHLGVQARDFRAAWRTFDSASELLPDALAELAPALRADDLLSTPFEDTLRDWRERGISREIEEKWREAGLPEEALKRAAEVARRSEHLPDNVLDPLRELVAGLHSMASTRRDWAREVLRLADE